MSLVARVEAAVAAAGLPPAEIVLDPPRHPGLGDLATPVALGLAKQLRRPPMEVAAAIARHLEGAQATPPGFLNWRLPDELVTTAPLSKLASSGARPLPTGSMSLQAARSLAMGQEAASVHPELDWASVQDPQTAWFWLQLKPAGQHLELDWEVMASQTVENPAYYVRYTLGRARSIVARAAQEGLFPTCGQVETNGRALAVLLLGWSDELRRQPQSRTRYGRQVAAAFHAYYASNRVFGVPEGSERLGLVDAAARVLTVVLEQGLGIEVG
jgi:arginyl-tRNA synthetase